MISTYIYGSPHGFNFYESVASLNDYFKSFYISTRKGRRLMVNRKDDGTTVYSFLCYGLMEKEGRPNAFFGCSVTLDDNRYCPDLKVLFEWFDYLFGRVVERGRLFFVNDGGILQYKVDKFSDIPDEIDWLKSNLPNIFTKSSDIVLVPYDATYTTRNLGKVVCCNIDTPVCRIIDDFRKSHWLAISPGFKPEEELEEMNFADLSSRLNEYNQKILAVAVNPSAKDTGLLRTIKAECADVMESLRKYHRAVTDEVEKRNCIEIREKYANLSGNIAALLKKIGQASGESVSSDDFDEHPPLRKCVKCNRMLPADSFLDDKTDVCSECDSASAPPKTRICRKCHAKKSESAFTRYVDVCDDCVKTARKTSLWENINTSYASIAIVAVIVLVSAFLIFGPSFGESDVEKERKERVLPGREVRNGINDGTFEEARFNRLLTDGKYYEAYDYAVSFGMKDVLAGVVEEAVFRKFREIIVETRPYTLISEKCLTFITANRRILQELNFDVDELNTFARSWQRLCEITESGSLTSAARSEAMRIINTLPVEQQMYWLKYIEAIPIQQSVIVDEVADMNFKVTLVNTDTHGNVLSSEIIDAVQSTTRNFRSGTILEVTADHGTRVRFDRGRGVTISGGVKLDLDHENTPVVFTIGNNMKLTVNVSSGYEFVDE